MCRIGLLAVFVLGAALVPTARAADLEPEATLKGHTEAVRSLGFKPDGTLVSTSYKEIHVWDVKDLKDIQATKFDGFTAHEYVWGTPRLSPCGKFVAVGGTYLVANGYSCAVRLFKLGDKIEAGGELAAVKKDVNYDQDTVTEVAISPDSKVLAALHFGTVAGKVQYMLSLHDLETSRSLNDSIYLSETPLTKLTYSPDGKLLAAGDTKGAVFLWKANTAKPLFGFGDAHKGAVNDLCFSPDNKTLATVGDDKTVRLWDIEKKELKKELGTHDDGVLCITYSKDGKYLATGGRDHNVKIWDVATSKELATIEAHLNNVTCLAFSPDGKTLATGSADKYVRLWSVAKALKK